MISPQDLPTPAQAGRSLLLIPFVDRWGRAEEGPERDAVIEELIEELGNEDAVIGLMEFAWTIIGAYAAASDELCRDGHGHAPPPPSVTVARLLLILSAANKRIIGSAQ